MISRNDDPLPELTNLSLKAYCYPLWVILFLAVIPLCFAYVLYFMPKTFRVHKAIQEAKEAYVQQQYDQAIVGYFAILHEFPNLKAARIGAVESLFARNNANDNSHQVALDLLTPIKLKKDEYERIKKVMPKKYEAYFKDTRS